MSRNSDLMLTGIAPAVWGSTYIVTTEFLPDGGPLTIAMLRALPAGLLLLVLVRRLPKGSWWLKVFILGALNFSIFWWLLFIAAYRLPGGVAATVGAMQPLLVIFMAALILGTRIRLLSIAAALSGLGGVALLLLTPEAALDPIGILAGAAGAVCMAAGTVLSRHWKSDVPLLTFTAWQLTAGGLLLLPFALWFEPLPDSITYANIGGMAYLCIIGAALTYIIWFHGVSRLEPSTVSMLGILSPLTAVMLGWVFLGQNLSLLQQIGVVIVLGSIWLSQHQAHNSKAERTPLRQST